MAGQVVDRSARDCLGNNRLGIGHHHIANDDEPALGFLRQLAQSVGAQASAKYQHPAAEGRYAEQATHYQPVQNQRDHRSRHRVGQRRAPEIVPAQQEIEERDGNDPQRNCDQQPRGGKAHRAQRVSAVDPDCDHGSQHHSSVANQLPSTVARRPKVHSDLPSAQPPCRFANRDQQRDVDQPQQNHGMGYIVFEQADHDPAAALRTVSE